MLVTRDKPAKRAPGVDAGADALAAAAGVEIGAKGLLATAADADEVPKTNTALLLDAAAGKAEAVTAGCSEAAGATTRGVETGAPNGITGAGSGADALA